MIRRTRRTKEIPFSFDSFLDVVANIVGIIIRLILVVWVGARSYSTIQPMLLQHKDAPNAPADAVLIKDDPVQNELARNRMELEKMKARLLEQLRDLKLTEEEEHSTEDQLKSLSAGAKELEDEETHLDHTALDKRRHSEGAELSLASMMQRQKKLMEEIHAVEKLPPLKKVLHYRTPVSEPVKTDEFFFECREGRITFIDIGSLKAMAENDIDERIAELRTQQYLTGATRVEGAFRLRFELKVVEGYGANKQVQSDFAVEPVVNLRGETANDAISPRSQFRQVVDRLNPNLAAVTFWVYPDSFALFRQLRDFLYERNIVVAGRPLPEGANITLSSHNGSASRGQ